MFKAALAITAALALTVLFQNCGGEVPVGNNPANLSSESVQNFSVELVPSSVAPNQPSTINFVGGTPPYQVTILQGVANVYNNSNVIAANPGNVILQVEDSSGFINQVSLLVQDAAPAPAPTPAPFVPAYRPATENCRGPRNSTCSITVPLDKYFPELMGRAVPNVELNVRHFNGRSDGTPCTGSNPTLNLPAGTTVSQTDGTNPDKRRLLRALYDASTRSLTLTSITSGWGDCGGSPCNSCISDVMIKPTPQ